MSVLRDVLEELYSMFAADAWLSLGILAIVAASAVASLLVSPLAGGVLLLAGCLLTLAGSVLRMAIRRK
ncbi:MAG TPA: hypothetical protein VMJ73_16045 [Rhizomicrobium sp.]|nr:hypothetical protein [Rhizomicrobium sp.]